MTIDKPSFISDRWRHRTRWYLLIACALSVIGLFVATRSGGERSTVSRTYSGGDWLAQVTEVEKRVRELDQNAVAVRIFANPWSSSARHDDTRVRILYVSSNNRYIDVTYLYSDVNTLTINPDYGNTISSRDYINANNRNQRAELINRIDISPVAAIAIAREAISQRLPQSSEEAFIEAVIEISDTSKESDKHLLIWSVSYEQDQTRLRVLIDSRTGDILEIVTQ